MQNKVISCLLVDDDPEDQEMFLDALHTVSATAGCYAISSAKEAIQFLQSGQFIPDIIFTDINMPGMNGLEFIRSVKNIDGLKAIPIIVYSGEYSKNTINEARLLGAQAIYAKTRLCVLIDILRKYFHEVHKPTIL